MAKQSNKDLYFAIRDLGYRPKIEHWRLLSSAVPGEYEMDDRTNFVPKMSWELNEIRERNLQDKINAKGGKTVCLFKTFEGDYLKDADGDVVCVRAHCSPKDNYNKKIGVHIALARALEYLRNQNA